MPSGKTRSTSTKATDDMADLKESIEFISAKLDELLPIRKEISCVLKAVEKLERDSAEKDKNIKAIGPKQDEKGAPRKRAVIVRFRSEAIRDEVFRARVNLKEHNRTHKDGQVFLNEDLTAKRAMFAFKTVKERKEDSGLLDPCRPRPRQNFQWKNHRDSQ